jgi:hypothetical protein
MTDDTPLVRYEPCEVPVADGTGSPVCASCGWLAHEHDGPGAVVALPTRPRPARAPRLAS